MELKEFADKYFKDKWFTLTKWQEEMLDKMSISKEPITLSPRQMWRKTLNQCLKEYQDNKEQV